MVSLPLLRLSSSALRLPLPGVLPEATSASLAAPHCLSGPFASLLGATRGKKSKGGGTTRNKCGHPSHKKRGIKVYDGQRVPSGSILATQLRLQVFPGWNVAFTGHNNLKACCHGRVMITTEKLDPKYGYDIYKIERYIPEHLRSRNIFRMHMHVVPDEPHQYFKLVDQI